MNNLLDPKTPLANFAAGTALDFWQWAYSDLKANNTRGVFAEWLVAQILELDLIQPRDSWAPADLVLPDKRTIEVKASAYLQTWEQSFNSKITFSGLKSKTYDYKTNQYSPEKTYNADIFIFCVQIEKDQAKWNAMDVSQWRFYVLTKGELIERNTKSISLTVLQKLTQELPAPNLQEHITRLVEK